MAKRRADGETIVAISTPPGQGAIGIVRLSGDDALRILKDVFRTTGGEELREVNTHTLRHGFVVDPVTYEHIDEVLVSYMAAPDTYTREDIVEINCHGGAGPLAETLDLMIRRGARMAEPGEFTRRAFVNGRIDLAQAEAVIDLIRAKSEKSLSVAMRHLEGGLSAEINRIRDLVVEISAQLEASLDFSDEDISPWSKSGIVDSVERTIVSTEKLLATAKQGLYIKEGIRISLVGKPNVGKSSVLNAILKKDRAIVTSIPGTTRDVIEEPVAFRGFPLLVADTAGMRETKRKVEKLGVERSKRSFKNADIVLCILDGSTTLSEEDLTLLKQSQAKPTIIAINKCDLPSVFSDDDVSSLLDDKDTPVMRISAILPEGIDGLLSRVVESIASGKSDASNEAIITNLRHKDALDRTLASLYRTRDSIAGNLSEEFSAADIREALSSIGEITGATVKEEILDKIFSQFCIGK